MQISKSEAAARQLHMAVTMYFEESDPVSIHALAHAADEIFNALHKQKHGRDLRHKTVEMAAFMGFPDFGKRINVARNFFKHGSDLNAVIDGFDDDLNRFIIMTASMTAIGAGIPIRSAHIFVLWSTWCEVKPSETGASPVPAIAWRLSEANLHERKSIGLKLLLDDDFMP